MNFSLGGAPSAPPKLKFIATISTTYRRICTVLAISLTAGLVLLGTSTEAIAQLNQSDNTGTNAMDPIGLNVLDDNTNSLDAATLTAAAELADSLDEAYAACVASQAAIADRPRRFARVPESGAESCTTAECERFNTLRQQAQTLLEQARIQLGNQPNPDRRRW